MNTGRATIRGLKAVVLYLGIGVGLPLTHADTGVVTIDGEHVPGILFEGYVQRPRLQNRICPPVSGNRALEEIVMARLLVREGERRDIVIGGVDKYSVKSSTEEFERLPDNAAKKRRATARWDLEDSLAQGYLMGLIGEIDDTAVLESYRQAIEQGHPKLVNLPLSRRTNYTLENAAERTITRLAIDLGATIPELERDGKLGTFDPYQSEKFDTVGYGDHLKREQAATLNAGDIVYSESDDRVIVYVHETKILSRVRLDQSIAGNERYARGIAYSRVYIARVQEVQSSLRKAAKVEVDGVEVKAVLDPTACID